MTDRDRKSQLGTRMTDAEKESVIAFLARLRTGGVVPGSGGNTDGVPGSSGSPGEESAVRDGTPSSSRDRVNSPPVTSTLPPLPPDADDVDRAVAEKRARIAAGIEPDEETTDEPGTGGEGVDGASGEAPEEEPEGKKGPSWKRGWQEIVGIVSMLPVSSPLHDRERVLRYLALYPAPRDTTAPFVLTVAVETAFNTAGIPEESRERLLRIPRKLGLALYSNLILGGNGLSPSPP